MNFKKKGTVLPNTGLVVLNLVDQLHGQKIENLFTELKGLHNITFMQRCVLIRCNEIIDNLRAAAWLVVNHGSARNKSYVANTMDVAYMMQRELFSRYKDNLTKLSTAS